MRCPILRMWLERLKSLEMDSRYQGSKLALVECRRPKALEGRHKRFWLEKRIQGYRIPVLCLPP